MSSTTYGKKQGLLNPYMQSSSIVLHNHPGDQSTVSNYSQQQNHLVISQRPKLSNHSKFLQAK